MSALLRPMGERTFLIEFATLDEVLAAHAVLAETRPAGIVDLVPAARTVLVRVDPRVLGVASARAWATSAVRDAGSVERAAGEVTQLDVAYDGDDLADTATLLGVSVDELVARHSGATWTVAFTGFAPGFGYLVSDDWPFDVPRLASPRTRVPAGAVGLAGAFSGAYPRETPGGWRLIGTTSARLFDPDASSPALLAPGSRVRFRPSAELGDPVDLGALGAARPSLAGSPSPAGEDPAPAPGIPSPAGEHPAPAPGIRIVEPGLLATVQDLGRTGAAEIGIAGSGALDRAALRTANRLVGNAEGAAGIEVTMGGLRAVAESDQWVAVTGAWGPIRLAGREIDPYQAHAWAAGDELHVEWFTHGARAYVAVRGGIEAAEVLGSRATDLLAGLGPAKLQAGELVTVGRAPSGPIPVAPPAAWGAPHDDELELELAPGPRADWFEASARRLLFETAWTVSNDADRVGVRLDGPELARSRTGELPSEGMVPGALQVPPSGRPTILLADGPVTGGYPVIAVVTDASLDLVAQARPGTRIRFRHARPSS